MITITKKSDNHYILREEDDHNIESLTHLKLVDGEFCFLISNGKIKDFWSHRTNIITELTKYLRKQKLEKLLS